MSSCEAGSSSGKTSFATQFGAWGVELTQPQGHNGRGVFIYLFISQ